ncbi:MAG: hypothetical protein WCF67_02085 [Chitinophagaceae bacterium]
MTDKKHDQPLSQPDPETTHTTDPQEHMEGPVSSFMQNLKEGADHNDHPAKPKEDDRKDQQRDENQDRDPA